MIYFILSFLGVGGILLFAWYLVKLGEWKSEVQALKKEVNLHLEVNRKKNTYIKSVDALVQNWKASDEKIREEYRNGPSADRLNKLFSSQSYSSATAKTEGAK